MTKIENFVFDGVNPVKNSKIFDVNKFKAFANDKSKAAKIMISPFDRLENFLAKTYGECISIGNLCWPFPPYIFILAHSRKTFGKHCGKK